MKQTKQVLERLLFNSIQWYTLSSFMPFSLNQYIPNLIHGSLTNQQMLQEPEFCVTPLHEREEENTDV
jgi:hypothetical protein